MRFRIALFGLLLAPSAWAQAVLWPAAAAPCNGSLQACVDAQPAGFSVLIASDTPTNIGGSASGDLNLPRSVHLFAAPGYRPIFPSGVGIIASMNAATTIEVRDIGLRNAGMRFVSSSSGTVDVAVRRVEIVNTGTGDGFEFRQSGTGTYQLRLEDSRYLRSGGSAAPVTVEAYAGTLNADLRFNRIELPDSTSSAYGIVGGITQSATLNLDAYANRIRGSFAYGALCSVVGGGSTSSGAIKMRAYGNVFTPAAKGSGIGICAFGGEAAATNFLLNNTIIDQGLAIYAGVRPFTPPVSPQAMTGFVINNLIAYNGTAVQQQALASAMTNGDNLLFGNTATGSGFTPHATTLNADPQLISRERPYLAASSPAINEGNGLALLFATGPTLPLFDGDGHRRFKGAAIDIGAYEYGDTWFRATAPVDQGVSNNFSISHPSVNGQSGARILATANHSITGTSLLDHFGLYQFGTPTTWAIYREGLSSMPAQAGFNLFEPASGSGRFLHSLAAQSSSSQLDDSTVNDNPVARVFITHHWNPAGGGGVYNDHPTGVYTYADDNWRIQSGDAALMPSGASFNVYAQDETPTAFRLVVDEANTLDVPPGQAVEIPLDEPAVACAVIIVTPYRTGGDDFSFDVYRRGGNGRWAIYSPTGLPDGTRFNVMYSPRQVFECAGPLFRNGFE